MQIAKADLGLSHIFVVYPGSEEAELADGVSLFGLKHLTDPTAQWRRRLRAPRR
jgi:hypothetical protein